MGQLLYGVSEKKTYSKLEQEQIIAQIDGTMSLEGMALTEDNKLLLQKFLSGSCTEEQCLQHLSQKWYKIACSKGCV